MAGPRISERYQSDGERYYTVDGMGKEFRTMEDAQREINLSSIDRSTATVSEAQANQVKADSENAIARNKQQTNADIMTNDYNSGVTAGQKILGSEGLGRLGNDAAITDVLARYKGYTTEGYGSQALETQRQAMNQGIDTSLQTSQRSLAGQLARSGVKGAAAGSQQMGLTSNANMQRNNVERDIFLKNADFQSQALEKYAGAVGNIKSFDLGQAAKEKNILLQSGFGFQQIGSADRGAATQAESARLQAAAASGGGGKKG